MARMGLLSVVAVLAVALLAASLLVAGEAPTVATQAPTVATEAATVATQAPTVATEAPSVAAADRAEAGTADWKVVVAGGAHSCGIRTSGRLYCWGLNLDGQLGHGGAAPTRSTPVQVAGNRTDWASVSVGFVHTCARTTTRRLYCWGSGRFGQLGIGGTPVSQTTPVQVAGNRTDWAYVEAGELHTCARRSSGRLYCWGDNTFGQLGNGESFDLEDEPVQVLGGGTDWAAVSAGGDHTCARTTTGRLFCWGRDATGQVGDGTIDDSEPAPMQVVGGRTDWASVTAGGDHTCARRTSGRLFCWGSDLHGQLGNGDTTTTDQATPVQVAGNTTDWKAVTAGWAHTCARRETGRLDCWGSDPHGQLGNGDTTGDQSTFQQVAGNRTDWSKISAGDQHTCARRTSGRIYCWGQDTSGELGDGGPFADQDHPVQVAP